MASSKLTQSDFEKDWAGRIAECEREKANYAAEWELYKNLWECKSPESDSVEKEIVADVVVQIVRPQILSAVAKELMYIYGFGTTLTSKIVGKTGLEGSEGRKVQAYENRLQDIIKLLLNQAGRFRTLSNARQACYIYGNVMLKIMPDIENPYRIFRVEVIDPPNAVFDTGFDKWQDVTWAGHKKIVRKEYLLSKKYYKHDVIKKLTERALPYTSTTGIQNTKQGIEITEIWNKKSKKFFTFADDQYLIREPEKFPYGDYFPHIWASAYSEANNPFSFGLSEILKNTQFYASLLREFRIDNLFSTVHNALVVPKSMRELIDEGEITPGRIYGVSSMKERPEQLFKGDITRGLDEEVQILRNEAQVETGFGPYALGQYPSKRVTSDEMHAIQQGSGRFWHTIKSSESDFWIPLMEKINTLIMNSSKQDLFDKLYSPIDELHNSEEYADFGKLTPADLKSNYKLQVQATMADRVMSEAEKRRELGIFLELLGTIGPEYFKKSEGIKYILRNFRHLPGIEDIVKTPEEVEAYREKQLQMAAQAQQQAQQQASFGESMRGPGGMRGVQY
jgi:hypothetical protein